MKQKAQRTLWLGFFVFCYEGSWPASETVFYSSPGFTRAYAAEYFIAGATNFCQLAFILPVNRMNQEQLIKECKQGSAAAQKCLFDHFAEKMMVICCRYIKNEKDAEEVLLDGFLKFFRTIDRYSYQGEAALYGWLKRIMINECLMWLRKRHNFLLSTDPVSEQAAIRTDVLHQLQAAEIYRMIINLPVGYRTVFNLYEIEGMSHKEIAEALRISEGTSKSQLSKAKQLLQKMLGKSYDGYAKRKIN